MKFLEFKTRITKIIKIYLFLSESQKIMKFTKLHAINMKTIKIELVHAIITKKNEIIINQRQNSENH